MCTLECDIISRQYCKYFFFFSHQVLINYHVRVSSSFKAICKSSVCLFICKWICFTFDSNHALPFHFLSNSLINAEVCFVKAFKSLSRNIWKSLLEAIMDDHSRAQTFAFCSQRICYHLSRTPSQPKVSFPWSRKRSSL